MTNMTLTPRFAALTAAVALALPLALPSGHALGAEPAPGGAAAAKLPLSDVLLYSSGVGFFHRVGEVEGDAQVEFRFKTNDVNDLLKSMVVQDFNGGHVSTVTYGSSDPIERTLKSFGVDLTENPTLGQLLDQVRGERVELLWPSKVTGSILGVEKKQIPAGENKTVEVEYINLLTEDGLQSIPLAQVQKTKLLNERLNGELRQALEVLATGHDTQKKTVAITFDGQGKRKVSVGYIAQTPVWKASYRLVLDEHAKPFLQGWAIVENTSDEDWDGVHLTLVSGRPVSFVMNLYQPLYTERPEVELEAYASLKPQLYGEALEQRGVERLAEVEGKRLNPPAAAPVQMMSLSAVAGMVSADAAPMTRLGRKLSLAEGVAPSVQGAQAGELFEYQIKVPVTLARQKSAMLPIVNDAVAGEKVSIYNQSVQAKYPLNGFRLKNTTTLHLTQGPITVFDSDSYAGDARIEEIAPGQERLLSYGLDLTTEVEVTPGKGANDLVSIKIRKGTLISARKTIEERVYAIRNRDQKPKTVLIEHPWRSDWELLEPKEKPERTRDVYRFPVQVEPDKTAKLVVRESRQFDEQIALLNTGNDTIAYYLRARVISAKAKEALQKVAQMRNQINATSAERSRREQRTAEITQEQSRIRENMQRLDAKSDLYLRYTKKLDQQETELESLRQEIESFKNRESAQQGELNDYLLNLDVE